MFYGGVARHLLAQRARETVSEHSEGQSCQDSDEPFCDYPVIVTDDHHRRFIKVPVTGASSARVFELKSQVHLRRCGHECADDGVNTCQNL